MPTPLRSLIDAGTKLWLDSIDPDLIAKNRAIGITGATSNPIIIGDLIQTGRFDDKLAQLIAQGHDDETLAWLMTDDLVSSAQRAFLPTWEQTHGNDGYVSFELDPLLEDPQLGPSHDERVRKYIELGKHWSQGQPNRMIKVPATTAGIDSLEELAAAGITLNVTLMFAPRQYVAARDAIWRGRQRFGQLDKFKSVYSIFISRVDVYTQKHIPSLSEHAQGQVGIVNAKRIWADNQQFWQDKGLSLEQEIIFASTGTKLASDPADKYVAALAGSDIQTNPPATNDAVQELGKTYSRQIDQMPCDDVLQEIDAKVDEAQLEQVLVNEGVRKFADPHKKLLEVIAQKRSTLAPAS